MVAGMRAMITPVWKGGLAALLLASHLAGPAVAQTTRTEPKIGPETNLPMPRFVSMKAPEGNVRRGPSLSHRIDWVFTRRDMPLRITGEFGHWRRVEDIDGAGGWMHYTLLSGVRTVVIREDMVPITLKPEPGAQVNAHLEAGVIARLRECLDNWCRVTADGHRGWVPKTALWGVEPGELRD